MSVPDHLFMFRAADSNVVLLVKAPDEPTAREVAERSSCNKYTGLVRTFQDWAFVDCDGYDNTAKTNMENAQIKLRKWEEYKAQAQQFINKRTETGNTDLETEVATLQSYLSDTVEPNIATETINLSNARSAFVVYNNDLL